MKLQIREGVFETNSSSTHSLALFNGSDWQAFKEGKMVIENGPSADKLINVKDVPKDQLIYDPNNVDEDIWFDDYDYIPYEVWKDIYNYADEGWDTITEVVKDSNGVDSTIVVSTYQEC